MFTTVVKDFACLNKTWLQWLDGVPRRFYYGCIASALHSKVTLTSTSTNLPNPFGFNSKNTHKYTRTVMRRLIQQWSKSWQQQIKYVGAECLQVNMMLCTLSEAPHWTQWCIMNGRWHNSSYISCELYQISLSVRLLLLVQHTWHRLELRSY